MRGNNFRPICKRTEREVRHTRQMDAAMEVCLLDLYVCVVACLWVTVSAKQCCQ